MNHYFDVCYTDKSQIIKKQYWNEKGGEKKRLKIYFALAKCISS